MRGLLAMVVGGAGILGETPDSAPHDVDRFALRAAVRFPRFTLPVGSRIRWGSRPPVAPERLEALRAAALERPGDVDAVVALARAVSGGEAEILFRKAIELCRKELASSPRTGLILARLGQAQAGVGNFLAAEKSLRDAVAVDPDRWETWVALGEFLMEDAIRFAREAPSPDENAPSVAKLLEESRKAYDLAVQLDPEQCETRIARAMFRISEPFLFGGSETHQPEFSEESVVDLWNAASLCEESVEMLEWATLAELLAAGAEAANHEELSLSQKSLMREKLAAPLERLNALSSIGPESRAAVVEESAALLRACSDDMMGAEEHAQRALSLDPDRLRALEVLIVVRDARDELPEAIRDCEELLERADSTRFRTYLASLHGRNGDSVRALEAAKIAFQSEPKDAKVMLTMTAALLKSPKSRDLLDAAETLRRTYELLESSEDDGAWSDYALLRAIFLGLAGDEDGARESLREILSKNPADAAAQAALRALGGPETCPSVPGAP